MSESFANYPISLSEVRSDRECDARLQTPRDVLIFMLREIDAGRIKPDTLIVVYRETDEKDGSFSSGYNASAPNLQTAIGMLTYSAHRIMSRT